MLYNIRKFHYVGGTQIRLYKRPVKTGEKKEIDLCDTLEEEECTAVKLENRRIIPLASGVLDSEKKWISD